MNRYLNIFEYYTDLNIIPNENNSTRNLAIVLRSEQLVLERFIHLIQTKIYNNQGKLLIAQPINKKDCSINIQVKTSDIMENIENEEINNIIGIALTTSNKEFNERIGKSNNTITDVVIAYGTTIIIVEAKINTADATEQLKGQIKELNKYCELDKEDIYKISLEWEEILLCLDNLNRLTGGSNIILDDYINHIYIRAPHFLPVYPISSLNKSDDILINKRLSHFANNYIETKDLFDLKNNHFHTTKKYREFWIKYTEILM